MRKAMMAVAVAATAFAASAGMWKGLEESRWYSGPKLTEEDLAGKVVMIDCWGVNCPPCRALLPTMQKYWNSFRNKNFVLIGSHCQGRAEEQVKALVKENGLTYPIYDFVGLAQGAPSSKGLPFMYVVNHRGKVVYSGTSHHEAITAAQEAMLMVGQPPSLTGGLIFDKKSPYRNIDKQLVLGKNVSSIVKKLESDVKKASSKAATPAQKAVAEEAASILKAVEEAKTEIPKEIDACAGKNPVEALNLAKLFMKTFPKDGEVYKEKLSEMEAAAKEWKAAEKVKAAEAAKAAKKK